MKGRRRVDKARRGDGCQIGDEGEVKYCRGKGGGREGEVSGKLKNLRVEIIGI